MRRLIVLSLLLLAPAAALASPEHLLQEGVDLLNAGQISAAIETLHASERQLPDRSQADVYLGEAYLRQGLQRLDEGDEEGARAAFTNAKGYIPDDPRPWQAAAIAWLHGGQPAPALSELYEALAIAGERSELLLLLGQAHYAAGDLVQAEEAWKRAAEQDGGGEAEALLHKVRRERQAEQTMSHDLAGRFRLAYAPGVDDALAEAVLETLQDAYQDVGRDLGYYPEADIPVLLYAREDFTAVTRAPEWAGALYDGKLRVPLGGVNQVTPPLKAMLYHEYAHVVVRFLTGGRVPFWLNEGIAEVAGRRHFAPPREALPLSGRTLAPEALEHPFSALPAEMVPLAYQQSYERVSRLVSLCGWEPLGELLRRLGSGTAWEIAVAEAYAPCGMDWPLLQEQLP